METSARSVNVLLAGGATAAVLLAGCGSSTPSGPSAPGSSPASTDNPTQASTRVTATETEFTITLSTTSFRPGPYTFDVENHGTMPHNLTIEGPGSTKRSSPTLQGGGSGQITVDLQPGTYELSCSIEGHKDLGMDLTIRVR